MNAYSMVACDWRSSIVEKQFIGVIAPLHVVYYENKDEN